MEIKQNPFSLYDFLGYFVPGALFLIGLGSIIFLSYLLGTTGDSLIKLLQLDQPGFYLPFILVAYLTGHIISFVSSVTLENYSTWKVGYPSKFLLGADYPKYFQVKEFKMARITTRIFVGLFLLPITVLDFCGNLLHLKELLYARKLDPTLTELLQGKFSSFLDKHAGLKHQKIRIQETDLFLFAYHYAVEHSPSHLPKMQNYVALYGFARTITMVLICLFWAVIIILVSGKIAFFISLYILFGLSVLSFLSFLNFMKFYRRFSLEVLMAISVII